MIMTLAEYDEYLKDGEDGKLTVIEETPQNIKNKLKKINKEYKKLFVGLSSWFSKISSQKPLSFAACCNNSLSYTLIPSFSANFSPTAFPLLPNSRPIV